MRAGSAPTDILCDRLVLVHHKGMSGIAILKLQRAGFSDEQVEALAEYHEAGAATKSDIAGLDRSLDTVRADLEIKLSDIDHKIDRVRSDLEIKLSGLDRKIDTVRADLENKIDTVHSDLETKLSGLDRKIDTVRVDLENKIDTVRTDLGLRIDQVRHDLELKIAEGKTETIRWVVGVGFAQVAMILALLPLFPGVHP